MKIKLLLLSFLICLQLTSNAQISIGSTQKEQLTDLDKGMIKKFKKTKTIFILSNILEKSVYETILKDTWTVTPYEVVSYKDFKIENYLKDGYSIAQISGFDTTRNTRPIGSSTGLYTFIDFKMYDNKEIHKKLAKLSPKKKSKGVYQFIEKHSHQIASIYLYPNANFIEKTMHQGTRSVVQAMFSEKVFLNYTPGLLKNYFQLINTTLASEKGYAMIAREHQPSIKELAINKLYIPEYVSTTYSSFKGKDSQPNETMIRRLFANYKHEYEMISDIDLSNRIMKNDAFYYLRYVRTNGEKFLEVVHSISGNVIYRNYSKGLSYKIKPKFITDLITKINPSEEIIQKSKAQDAIVNRQ